ncbi:MAG: DUF3089 domain-containing protein, partial [Fibromonadaceae bacterium]|nr:DUF3089 domain-containing protein [Fibromonadaceae bacterium]
MKKVFFFLVFSLFIVVSCSNQNENEPTKPNEVGDSSSSALSAVISSSSITPPVVSSSSAMPSSSDGETLSSSDGETLSSSDVGTQSSSATVTLSSSSRATGSSSSRAGGSSSSRAAAGSSSSAYLPPPVGGLTCADPVNTAATDYSDMNNWSVYTADDKLTKDVDIFLLYPTSIQSSDPEDCPYARINNSSMRRSVDQWYSGIRTVVTSHANVYLPYYRQANVFGSGCSGANMTGGAAMEDVIASFQYYLTHINKGQRPFMTLG